MKNRTNFLSKLLGHIRKRYAFIDNFEFATNEAINICIGMLILFWLGSCFEILFVAFLLYGVVTVVLRWQLGLQLFFNGRCTSSSSQYYQYSSVMFVGSVQQMYSLYFTAVSESFFNLCLCFQTSVPVVSLQVQSVSVSTQTEASFF